MNKIHVMLVVGARPQFIKSAPVIKEIITRHKRIELRIVHSGQHYDREMSDIFFRELRIPAPLANLRAGSGSHAAQTAAIMKRLEDLMQKTKPRMVIVPGDTNTTLAGALSAAKLGIPVAHIEAGMRSGDMSMPEEINRTLTDHCSTILFAPTKNALHNLRREGLGKRAHLTGDTMVDVLHFAMPTVRKKERAILTYFGARPRKYALVTLHRPSNVDHPERLRKVQSSLQEVAKRLKPIFPVHPRTYTRLTRLRVLNRLRKSGVTLTRPLSYIESLSLLRNASCLLTDSGGMQKEAFLLHVPCITLRSTTEWPETLKHRANSLVSEPEKVPRAVFEAAFKRRPRENLGAAKNPFGDGHASCRIAEIIERSFEKK